MRVSRICIAFALGVSMDVSAAPADALPAGGNTIGGPGKFAVPPQSSVYFTSGIRPYPALCATIANRGENELEIIFSSGVVNTVCVVSPNTTETCCAQDVGAVRLNCLGATCKGVYRVDRQSGP